MQDLALEQTHQQHCDTFSHRVDAKDEGRNLLYNVQGSGQAQALPGQDVLSYLMHVLALWSVAMTHTEMMSQQL